MGGGGGSKKRIGGSGWKVSVFATLWSDIFKASKFWGKITDLKLVSDVCGLMFYVCEVFGFVDCLDKGFINDIYI